MIVAQKILRPAWLALQVLGYVRVLIGEIDRQHWRRALGRRTTTDNAGCDASAELPRPPAPCPTQGYPRLCCRPGSKIAAVTQHSPRICVSYLVSARATPLQSAPDRRPSSSIALVCWFEFGSACCAAPIRELDTSLTVVFMELWSVERSSSWMFCALGLNAVWLKK